jgi:hypothetical protein
VAEYQQKRVLRQPKGWDRVDNGNFATVDLDLSARLWRKQDGDERGNKPEIRHDAAAANQSRAMLRDGWLTRIGLLVIGWTG